MKKRLFSLIMALCPTLTLFPAAFAAEVQPDPAAQTTQLPEVPKLQKLPELPEGMPKYLFMPDGEAVEVLNLNMAPGQEITDADLEVNLTVPMSGEAAIAAISDNGYSGSGTQDDPYKVYTGEGLLALGGEFESTAMTLSRIYLVGTIDMSEVDVPRDYIFRNFAGVIQSDPALIAKKEPAVIKGLPANVSLIYNWFMGTMGYFDVELTEQPSRLARMPGMVGGQYPMLKMQNINVYSGTQSANLFSTRAAGADAVIDAYETYLNKALKCNEGTDRYGATETLTGDNTTITVKRYGVCDYIYGTEGLTFDDAPIGGRDIANYNNQKYYWLDNREKVVPSPDAARIYRFKGGIL